MKKSKIIVITISSLLISFCFMKCNTGKNKRNDTTQNTNQGSAEIHNGIILETNGLQVSKAYLSLDNGKPVPDDNTVSLNQNINLVINVDKGWKETDGKVYLGASEKITLDNGTIILDIEDLFKDNTGSSPTDAKTITLTSAVHEEFGAIKYYTATFLVWDKKGSSNVAGSYKFYIK